MKCTLLVLTVMFAYFAVDKVLGDVDSCEECYSEIGWDDCNKKMNKTSCADKCGSKTCDTCQKVEFEKPGLKIYTKGCTLEKICEAQEDGCAMNKMECKVWCCSGDDCNGVGSNVASMSVVAFLGLMTLLKITLV